MNETENIIKLVWYNQIDSCNGMFYECSNITEIDLSHFDSSNVTEMVFMFGNCSSLQYLNLSNFDTSQVTDMFAMFY